MYSIIRLLYIGFYGTSGLWQHKRQGDPANGVQVRNFILYNLSMNIEIFQNWDKCEQSHPLRWFNLHPIAGPWSLERIKIFLIDDQI